MPDGTWKKLTNSFEEVNTESIKATLSGLSGSGM